MGGTQNKKNAERVEMEKAQMKCFKLGTGSALVLMGWLGQGGCYLLVSGWAYGVVGMKWKAKLCVGGKSGKQNERYLVNKMGVELSILSLLMLDK